MSDFLDIWMKAKQGLIFSVGIKWNVILSCLSLFDVESIKATREKKKTEIIMVIISCVPRFDIVWWEVN